MARLISPLEPLPFPDDGVIAAADYLLQQHERTGKAIVPTYKDLFDLTTPQAIAAIQLAEKMREARRLP